MCALEPTRRLFDLASAMLRDAWAQRTAQAEALLACLRDEARETKIQHGGDFGTVDWKQRVRALLRLTKTKLKSWSASGLYWTKNLDINRRRPTGSTHLSNRF